MGYRKDQDWPSDSWSPQTHLKSNWQNTFWGGVSRPVPSEPPPPPFVRLPLTKTRACCSHEDSWPRSRAASQRKAVYKKKYHLLKAVGLWHEQMGWKTQKTVETFASADSLSLSPSLFVCVCVSICLSFCLSVWICVCLCHSLQCSVC